jgi:hypothetical protein
VINAFSKILAARFSLLDSNTKANLTWSFPNSGEE